MESIILPVILVAGVGALAGLGLAVANYFMGVKGNETAEKIVEILPGVNCGACSYSGCMAYAQALSTGKVKTTLCTVGGDETAVKISEILGVEAKAADKRVAVVYCQGSFDHTNKKFEYQGIETCSAAAEMYGGDGECGYGCIGLGDCVRVCNYDALAIINGVAVVDPHNCVACGLCVTACPKRIIKMLPKKTTPLVLCANTDKGAQTRKVCSVGCIGCRLCFRACEYDAIYFDKGLAVINRDKCVNCGKCEPVCPTKSILTCL